MPNSSRVAGFPVLSPMHSPRITPASAAPPGNYRPYGRGYLTGYCSNPDDKFSNQYQDAGYLALVDVRILFFNLSWPQ
jgi:hypothetical protein